MALDSALGAELVVADAMMEKLATRTRLGRMVMSFRVREASGSDSISAVKMSQKSMTYVVSRINSGNESP